MSLVNRHTCGFKNIIDQVLDGLKNNEIYVHITTDILHAIQVTDLDTQEINDVTGMKMKLIFVRFTN